jgi:hypothetical protein
VTKIPIASLGAAMMMLSANVAWTQEPGEDAPLPLPPPAPASQRPKVPVPAELLGRLVVVTTAEGTVEGKLVAIDDDAVTVDTYSLDRKTIDRAVILEARLRYPNGTASWGASLPEVARQPAGTDSIPSPDSSGAGQGASTAAQQPAGKDSIPSPWGAWFGVALGPAWGQPTGPAHPVFMVAFDIAASFHFVYVGTGFTVTSFGGAGSFSNETTVGTLSSGAPSSLGTYIEAGLAKSIFIPYNPTEAVQLRPGVGYGLAAMTAAEQGIGDCVDCDTRSFDYGGGHYVRFQLGVFYSQHPKGSVRHRVFMSQNGFFTGCTTSFQEFVFGSGPRLNHVLTFAYTVGWGGP